MVVAIVLKYNRIKILGRLKIFLRLWLNLKKIKDMQQFTHLDADGNPSMVDVSEKKVTKRTARARAIVILNDEILSHFEGNDIKTKKGSVFQIAVIAGVMAAKKTGDLIPLCHPLGLENCQIDIALNEKREVIVECTASLTGKTGIEMEVLTGATVAALTIYDMCKAFSHDIEIKSVMLMEKTGGKRDFKRD
jgi:cyclic pyranopterin monophosphate synthase